MAKVSERAVGIWLLIGVFMILVQIAIGGITRLTESGLSITEWDVVSGTLPPLDQAQWEEEFEKYKQSPQYRKVNVGMSLQEFKDIYFWEWFHRLWGRILGFVFLIPFIYFLVTKSLSRSLIQKAVIAFILGGLVGAFGWIMVASGLQDRPLVSPYKLAIHLSLAIITLGYIFWVAMQILSKKDPVREQYPSLKNFSLVLTLLISLQIILGALVSGMRAAKFYPTWPDMNGEYIPDVLLNAANWTWKNFVHFEQTIFTSALMQFLHRNLAYIITILIVIFIVKMLRSGLHKTTKSGGIVLLSVLVVQVTLGIITLINSFPTVPVALGVIHQVVAVILLMVMLFLDHRLLGERSVREEVK